jgi:hypothetical protein
VPREQAAEHVRECLEKWGLWKDEMEEEMKDTALEFAGREQQLLNQFCQAYGREHWPKVPGEDAPAPLWLQQVHERIRGEWKKPWK